MGLILKSAKNINLLVYVDLIFYKSDIHIANACYFTENKKKCGRGLDA